MKKISKLFFFAACLSVMAVACKNSELDPYVPATEPAGNQIGFPEGIPTTYSVTPDMTSISIPLQRGVDYGSLTTSIAVTDTSKLFVPTASLNAEFASGSKETSISFPVSYDDMVMGLPYAISLAVPESDATPYATANLSIIVIVPEPWEVIGKARYIDEWIWEMSDYVELTLEQNQLYPNTFRLTLGDEFINAMIDSEGLEKDNFSTVSDYLTFKIMKAGESVNGVTLTSEDDLVFFDTFDLGYYYASYEADILSVHSYSFSGGWGSDPMDTDESYWVNSKVSYYQDNGLPAMIELAPNYYMIGVGGWKYYTSATQFIVFPDVVLSDFSIESEFTGILGTADGDYAVVDVTLGEDVEYALVAIAPGDDPQDALDLILAEDESVVTVETSGEVKLPLTELVESYSYVAVSVGNDELQELTYETIAYKDYSISVAASEPVINDDEVSGTVTASFIFGADVEYAKLAIFEGKSSDLTEEDLAIFDEEDNEDVIIVKHADDTIDIVLPEEGDYTLVAVSYALEQAWNISVRDIEFVLVNPWEPLGYIEYTDDIIGPLFQADPISYYVPIEKHNEKEGLYRLVYPYGEVFPYNDEGDYDATADHNIIIDASNPERVKIPYQNTGCNWGYGDMYIEDLGSYYLDYDYDEDDVAGYFGTLVDGVISFDVQKMVVFDDDGAYYANKNGGFVLDLNAIVDEDPSAAPAKRKVGNAKTSVKVKLQPKDAVSIARGRLSKDGSVLSGKNSAITF